MVPTISLSLLLTVALARAQRKPENEQLNPEVHMSNTDSYNFIYGATTVVGLALVALVLSWISKYEDGFGWASSAALEFNWHPFLMVLSLVFLYSQSILIYRTGRYHTSKKNLKYMHALIHLIAFICAIVGLRAVFDAHIRQSRPNLYSLHSWLGLITVIVFGAQFLFGLIAFSYPGIPGPEKKRFLPYHVFLGTAAFVMAVVTTVAGITEVTSWTKDYSSLPPAAYVLNFMGLLAVVYGVLTLYLLLKPEYKRMPLAAD